MNLAFCIGNGPSRLKFNMTLLENKGTSFGCNYLIETHPLDYTIVVDRMLVVNMVSQHIQKKTNLYTRRRWQKIIDVELNYLNDPIKNPFSKWDNEIHWGSGTHALNLAAEKEHDLIIMLGYDLYSGNVYNNTTVDPSCWIYQIKNLLLKYPETQFVQIQPKGWKVPDEWKLDNFSLDTFKALEKMLKD